MSLLITFEGIEGCGKTTQSKRLYQHLHEQGYDVLCSREPGGVPLCEEVRKLLLDPKYKGQVGSNAELFLFEASRSQFFESLVLPALQEGKIVLLDRCYDSTTAYQGYGRGMDKDFINLLNITAVQQRPPDLTLILDRDARKGLAGATADEFGKADRFEQETLEFHERVRQGFLAVAQNEPHRVKVVEYRSGDAEGMHKEIRGYVLPFLEKVKNNYPI